MANADLLTVLGEQFITVLCFRYLVGSNTIFNVSQSRIKKYFIPLSVRFSTVYCLTVSTTILFSAIPCLYFPSRSSKFKQQLSFQHPCIFNFFRFRHLNIKIIPSASLHTSLFPLLVFSMPPSPVLLSVSKFPSNSGLHLMFLSPSRVQFLSLPHLYSGYT